MSDNATLYGAFMSKAVEGDADMIISFQVFWDSFSKTVWFPNAGEIYHICAVLEREITGSLFGGISRWFIEWTGGSRRRDRVGNAKTGADRKSNSRAKINPCGAR